MPRSAVFLLCAFAINVSPLRAQRAPLSDPISDPIAVQLAQQSMTAMSRGSIIDDVKLTANVAWIGGADPELGSGVLLGKGTFESKVTLALSEGGKRVEIRNSSQGPAGSWTNPDGKSGKYSAHNCWTDSVWFFPLLSSITKFGDSTVVFSYIGDESWNGLATKHLRAFQVQEQSTEKKKLSTMDIYIDPTSLLMLGASYTNHPDNDMNVDIPMQVRFADYQLVNGVEVPFRIQRLQNGGVQLDISVTDIVFNSGLLDDTFQAQ